MKQETILLVINEQRREKIIKIDELNAACRKVNVKKTLTHKKNRKQTAYV